MLGGGAILKIFIEDSEIINSTVNDTYIIEKRIGTGGMSDVFTVKSIKNHTEEKLVIKIMSPEEDIVKNIKNEIKANKKLINENIIKYHDSGIIKDGKLKGAYFIVMEFADNSLRDELTKATTIKDEKLSYVASQLATGINFLHNDKSKEKIIHSDLKPENILNVNGIWKISDFGLSASINKNASVKLSKMMGTEEYLPPEYFEDIKIGKYTDIYSFGMVLLECLVGSKKASIIAKKIMSGENVNNIETDISEYWYVLICNCLSQDYRKRPNITTIIKYLNGEEHLLSINNKQTCILRKTNIKFSKKRKIILLSSALLIVVSVVILSLLNVIPYKDLILKNDPNVDFDPVIFTESSPILLSPGSLNDTDIKIIKTTTPNFKWKSQKGTEYYKFALYKEPYENNDIVLMKDKIQNCEFKIEEGILQPNTAYCWILKGANASQGSFSKYAESYFFKVNDIDTKDLKIKSVDIYDYYPKDEIEVKVGEKVQLKMSFLNSGNMSSVFLTGASIWNNDGINVANFEDRVQTALKPNEKHTASWTFEVVEPGIYWLQYAVWLDENTLLKKIPSPARELIKTTE
jgi:serine/threonine protein kinase